MHPEHMREIFSLAGIVMPAVLMDGEVVGRWKKKNKKLSVTMFSTATQREKNIITDAVGALWDDIVSITFDE